MATGPTDVIQSPEPGETAEEYTGKQEFSGCIAGLEAKVCFLQVRGDLVGGSVLTFVLFGFVSWQYYRKGIWCALLEACFLVIFWFCPGFSENRTLELEELAVVSAVMTDAVSQLCCVGAVCGSCECPAAALCTGLGTDSQLLLIMSTSGMGWCRQPWGNGITWRKRKYLAPELS